MNRDSPSPRPRAARLRERQRESTRDAILGAAEELIAEGGLGRARMERIAAAAGVSVGTLYNHFRDRDALLAALFELRRADLFARVDQALAEAGGTRERRLEAATAAVFAHAADHHRFLALVVQGEVGRRALTGAPAVSPTFEGLRARFEGVLGGRRARRRTAADPAWLADLYTGMVRAMMLRMLVTPETIEPARAALRLTRVFLDGARR